MKISTIRKGASRREMAGKPNAGLHYRVAIMRLLFSIRTVSIPSGNWNFSRFCGESNSSCTTRSRVKEGMGGEPIFQTSV